RGPTLGPRLRLARPPPANHSRSPTRKLAGPRMRPCPEEEARRRSTTVRGLLLEDSERTPTMTRRTLLFLLSTMVVLGILAGPAHAQFVLYDDFAGGVIDPERWSGSSVEGGGASPTGEVIRIVQQGVLRLALESHGGVGSDTGLVVTRQ